MGWREDFWFETCDSEDEAERLHHRLKNAGLIVGRADDLLGGLGDERDKAEGIIADQRHENVTIKTR